MNNKKNIQNKTNFNSPLGGGVEVFCWHEDVIIPTYEIGTYRSKSRLKTLELLDIIIFAVNQRL